jgi:diaminohydroxyphosphoribosylaminopyrimidine deaminase/5-amino-6-(5-phosphoribosylamino)uracil reductase
MDYMAQAISLARLALGQASPNPAVGAVVVRDGVVVGQGYTQPPGSHHAEIVALEQAGDAARGGELYVTLEPCCHQGRTPPCTGAIIGAGVAEVHMAGLDPNPLVSGRGEAELRANGIRTHVGEHEEDAREITEAYSKYITTGVPFVTAKFAMSLDGKIATRSGDSKWISSEESRKYVHSLRFVTDAIMVGVNTLLADDPRLTSRCRGNGGRTHRQPLRVIVDGKGRTSPAARIFGEPGRTLLALGTRMGPDEREAFSGKDAELVELPTDEGLVDLKELLRVLGERDVTSVLVEGGGILLGSLFDLGLVDKVIAFISPIVIGGAEAETPVAGVGVDKVAESVHLRRVMTKTWERDVMVTGYVRD